MTQIYDFITITLPAVLGAMNVLIYAVIGIAMLIPGVEPERTLHKWVDWLSQFSRKKPPGV